MSKISGQLLISGQFQDKCEISGISGQLGALLWQKIKLHKIKDTYDTRKCTSKKFQMYALPQQVQET